MDKKKKPRVWNSVKMWVSKYHQITWVASSLVVIIAFATASYLIIFSNKPPVSADESEAKVVEITPEEIIEAPKYYSPLTGELVANESDLTLPVTGIMIENSPESRPQSGLKNSGIVFEAIAEAGITRFLVLYQNEKPQMIGPVRSLRLYDVDWAAAFNASIGHVGGSAGALTEVRNGQYRDIDQFFNESTYWRATDKYAPHNVYTSFEKLDALNKAKGYTSSIFNGFTRTTTPMGTTAATKIYVTISSSLFNSSYIYNETTKTYDRSQAGEPHLDREDGQISPSSVVVMKVDETTVLEDGYREKITTIGTGDVTIFQNGTITNGKWNKTSLTSQITFTTDDGVDIPLVPGQTWITAIPNDTGKVIWQ